MSRTASAIPWMTARSSWKAALGTLLGNVPRGGKIFIRTISGYRTALHMKEYLDKKPVLVVGGTSQDFRGKVDKLQVAGQVDISEPKEEGLGSPGSRTLESSWNTSQGWT